MKINKKLRLNTFISLVIIITMMVTLAWLLREVYRANQKMLLTDEMRKITFERIFLRDNYIINPSKQTKILWQTKSKNLQALLESASKTFTGTEDMALLQEARKDFEKTFSSFSEIIEQYEQKDHAGKKFVFSQTSLKQISMVFLNAQLLNDSLDRLYELCESTTKKTQNIMGFLIVFFTIGGTLMIAVNSAFLNKMLTKRIKTLHEGIEIIGGGNLDYQIDMKGDDELSVLPGS